MKRHLRQPSRIYDRIRKIIEIARSNIAHAVNVEMVRAYWHIGKEIVDEERKGSNWYVWRCVLDSVRTYFRGLPLK